METEAPQFDNASLAPEGRADENPGRAALLAGVDSDDTGIDAGLLGNANLRRRRPDRVRIGRIAVPTGPFAFASAVAIHAALVGGALLSARWIFQPPRLPGEWGGGGGGQVSLNEAEAPADPAQPGVPGGATRPPVIPPPVPSTPPAEPPGVGDRSIPRFSSARATQLDQGASVDASGDPDPLIGAAAAAEGARTPLFKHRSRTVPAGDANPSSSSPGSAARASGGTASNAAGGTGTSHAGLPGELRRQGIPAPDYPPQARRHGEQGVVKVAVEVLPDGSLGRIRVVSDPGYPLLRDAALAATQKLRRFPFTPAYRFGKPVADVVVIPYHFILE